MFKKTLAVLLVIAMAVGSVFALTACQDNNAGTPETTTGENTDKSAITVKIGVICLHDRQSTYDNNFITAVENVKAALNLGDDQVIIKTGIPESNDCAVAAEELINEGCDIIFADSFGHEEFLLDVAKRYPNVDFCHATGTHAHTEGLANFHNAFAAIYEGRYLAGIAAGLKLNEMIEAGKITADQAVIGYIGAFTYAEVISGYTSFYLGARSVCPSATMKVQFTGSWYDEIGEKNAANALMDAGCVLISQHADSMGAPTACESRGVPNISYNGSTVDSCPNTFVVASRINWEPYFKYILEQKQAGKAIDTDWTGTIATGSVVLTDINDKAAAAGTKEAIDAATEQLKAGTLHVFATDTFTVGGSALTSYKADVDTDANFEKDTEVVSNGYFHESEYRSAPYFDITIDGITLLNDAF